MNLKGRWLSFRQSLGHVDLEWLLCCMVKVFGVSFWDFRGPPGSLMLSLFSHGCQHTWKGTTPALRPQEKKRMPQPRVITGQHCRVVCPDPLSCLLFPCSVDWSGHRDLPPGAVQKPGLLSAVSMRTCSPCLHVPAHPCLSTQSNPGSPTSYANSSPSRVGATEAAKVSPGLGRFHKSAYILPYTHGCICMPFHTSTCPSSIQESTSSMHPTY